MNHLETITADLRRLTPDELAAFRYILDRVLVVGRASYSPWVAEQETRDMVKEGADEGGDLCVYAGFGAVLRHIKRQRLIAEFKAAACDHWNELVEQDTCTGCGENAFDSVAYDALPTDSYLSAQAHAIAAFDFSDEEVTSQFRVEPLSNTASLESSISAASSSAPSNDSPTLDGTGLPNGEGGAAPISCADCVATSNMHEAECPWVVVVPAKGDAA